MRKPNIPKTSSLGKNISMLAFASVLISAVAVSSHEAFAMGQAPSTCDNRYDGVITAMKIMVGQRAYNPIAHPDLTFRLQDTKSYTVTYTIHTTAQSSQGNTLGGSTWIDTSSTGYELGQCVNGVGPDQYVTKTVTESHPANLTPGTEQTVTWNTLAPNQVTYNIKWESP